MKKITLLLFYSVIFLGDLSYSDTRQVALDLSKSEISDFIKYMGEAETEKRSEVLRQLKAKQTDNANLLALLGLYFDRKKEYQRSRYYFTESIKGGRSYAVAPNMARYQVLGLGGSREIVAGLQAGIALTQTYDGAIGFTFLLNDLQKDSGFDLKKAKQLWYMWILDKMKGQEVHEKNIESTYRLLSTSLPRNLKRKKTSEIILPKDNQYVQQCEKVFFHGKTLSEFAASTQAKIFENPEKKVVLLNEYKARVRSHFYSSPDEAESDRVSLNFMSIKADYLIKLLLDFDLFFTKFDLRTAVIEKNIGDIKLAMYAENWSSREILSRLVDQFGINVSCSEDGMRFSIDQDRKKQIFFTPGFITDWSGQFSFKGGSVSGKGKLMYGKHIEMHGDIRNSKLEGKGALSVKELTYKSNDFNSGLINGYGEILLNGVSVFRGGFLGNDFDGKGEFASHNWIYNGMYDNGSRDGDGKVLLVSRELEAGERKKYWYPLKNKPLVKSWYEGPFVKGAPHGEGRCGFVGIHKSRVSYTCKFHQGYLYELASVSLLPPAYEIDDDVMLPEP